MADARIIVKIEGLEKLIEAVEQLKQMSLDVSTIGDHFAKAQASIDAMGEQLNVAEAVVGAINSGSNRVTRRGAR